MNKMDGESIKSDYGRFGICIISERTICVVVEVIKYNILKWFGHVERMAGNERTRRINKDGVDDVGGRTKCWNT